MVLAVLTGWLDRRERQAIAYLMEENRVLRRQLGQRRLKFTDTDRRRLAVRGHRLGRQVLRQISTIVTPGTENVRYANCERALVLLIVHSLLIRVAPALNWFNESHALEVGLQGTSEKTL